MNNAIIQYDRDMVQCQLMIFVTVMCGVVGMMENRKWIIIIPEVLYFDNKLMFLSHIKELNVCKL